MPDRSRTKVRPPDFAGAYVNDATAEFSARIKRWKLDLAQQEVHEVVGALLARQTTLATGLARCPHMWTPHIAPVLLRAMADVHISLSWILNSPADRSQKFIAYGLGQVKLLAEHRKLEMERRGKRPEDDPLIGHLERWVESQRWLFLTEVNIANWSGLSTREMAEEAGCLDFYNLVYVPFSAAAHSTWHHVSGANLEPCRNALHRNHLVPTIASVAPDPDDLVLVAKYLDKTFRLFDEKTGVSCNVPSAYAKLLREFDRLGRALQTRRRPAAKRARSSKKTKR